MEKNLVSSCHKKPVTIQKIQPIGLPEKKEKEIYVCSECGNECDALEKVGS